jgi:hypothetical protein
MPSSAFPVARQVASWRLVIGTAIAHAVGVRVGDPARAHHLMSAGVFGSLPVTDIRSALKELLVPRNDHALGT